MKYRVFLINILLFIFCYSDFGNICLGGSFDKPSEDRQKKSVLFKQYLSGFKEWKELTFSSCVFGNSIIEDPVNKDVYSLFLPCADTLSEQADFVYWQRGYKIMKSNFIETFLKRFCEYGYGAYSYMDDVIITYSLNGNIIDSKVIGREGRAYYNRMNKCMGDSFMIVEQATLIDKGQLLDYGDLHFSVKKIKFTVGYDGRIRENIIGDSWREIKVRDSEMNDSTDFGDYLALFLKWDERVLSESLFQSRPDEKEIGLAFRKHFIPEDLDCQCERRELRWFPRYVMVQEEHIICFLTKNCDLPKTVDYPYSDDVIIIYDKNGGVLDHCLVGRSGDAWFYVFDGKSSPFRLTVKQATLLNINQSSGIPCEIEEKTCTFTEDGYIEMEGVRKYEAISDWDSESFKYNIRR